MTTKTGLDYIRENAKPPSAADSPVLMVDAIMSLDLDGMTPRRARRIVENRHRFDYGIAEIELKGGHCMVLPSTFTEAWNAGKIYLPPPRQSAPKRASNV